MPTKKTGNPVGRPKGATNMTSREAKAKYQGYTSEGADLLIAIARDTAQNGQVRVNAIIVR